MITITCDKCNKRVKDIELLKVSTSIRQTSFNDPREESLHFHKECWRRVKQYIAKGGDANHVS